MNKSKHKLRLRAAKLLEPYLPYTSYEMHDIEYLGTFDGSAEDAVSYLESQGYHYQLLAATKTRDGTIDSGSYCRMPSKHPVEAAETALEKRDPKECQYHVHLFPTDDGVNLYGHYELSPYPHIPDWDSKRPKEHYNPTYDRDSNDRSDWTYLRGVVDPLIEHNLS